MRIEPEFFERRSHDRRSCDIAVSCYPLSYNGGPRWDGRIAEFSRGGVRLVVPHWFEEGTIVKIHVEELEGEIPLTFFGRVLHVSPHPAGGWTLGCHLTPAVEEEDLEAMFQECVR